MGIRESQKLTNQSGIVQKVILGIIAAVSTAVIGSAGIAAAQSNNGSDSQSFVTYCKEHYRQLGYENLGQCVSHHNGHVHGYGGGDDIHGENDNNQGDQGDNHFHFHIHSFFGNWWHHVEHDF